MHSSLFYLFKNSALDQESICLIWEDKKFSRTSILEANRGLADYLISVGVRRGCRVAYIGKNGHLPALLPFAASLLDFTYAPVGMANLTKGLSHFAKEASIDFLFCDPGDDERIAREIPFSVEDLQWRARKSSLTFSELPASVPRFLFLSSGTTGSQKYIGLSEDHILQNISAAIRGQSLQPTDICLSVISLCHSGGLCIQFLPALCSGSVVVLAPEFRPKLFLSLLQKFNPTVTLLVPTYLRQILSQKFAEPHPLASLRLIGVGSTIFPLPLLAECRRMGIKLLNIYGLTEAGPFSLMGEVETDQSQKYISVGGPAAGMEIKLVPENEGEIYLRGRAARPSYLKEGAWLSPLGENDWLPTGDIGFSSMGRYFVTERKSNVVHVGGLKVYPNDIENVIRESPAVEQCLVTSRLHTIFGEILVAYIEVAKGKNLNRKELLRFCKARLSRQLVPREIHLRQTLPTTSLGKIKSHEFRLNP